MQKKIQSKKLSLHSLCTELSEDQQAAITGGSNPRPYTGPTAVKWVDPRDRMLPPGYE